jgi:putative spermidine/putrescine transport system permease protein
MADSLMIKNNRLVKYFYIGLVALLSLLIFIIPLLAATIFSFKGNGGKGFSFANYQWLIEQDGFGAALSTTLRLAVLAAVINLLLMVPTMTYLHLRGKKWKPLVDAICILPLIIPVVSLAIGAQVAMPEFLQNTEYELVFFYVIIGLPFTFRALDTSLSSVPISTLVEASRSLGAGWINTIIRVIIPAIRSGITAALFLSFALSIGEYTITSLLHWDTFPTWTVVAAQQNILGAIAISVFTFAAAILLMSILGIFSQRKVSRTIIDEASTNEVVVS